MKKILIIFFFLSLISEAQEYEKAPNIILIMVDDLGAECLNSYGGTSYETPFLNKMSENGMQFENTHSMPICTPSRVKLMTGKSNKKNHVEFYEGKVKDGIQSFFQGLSISILNPKILIWFLAIYSQFMSLNNDVFFNLSLILIASTVDALWYILLVNLVTSKNILELVKNKSYLIQRIVGCLFIILSIILLIDLFK